MSNTKSNTTGELRPGYLPSFRKRIPFVDALKLFKEHPALCESAFGRLERLITREGLDEVRQARLARLGSPKTVKAYNACRLRNGGTKCHCKSPVMGFRCTEKRSSGPVQFIASVTCSKPRQKVTFSYSENT